MKEIRTYLTLYKKYISEKLDYESYFGELNYILKSVAELTM